MGSFVNGIRVTPLKQIPTVGGSVLHVLKASEPDFNRFGEVYFSTVENGAIRGWKRHRHMRLNLVVPQGSVRFVFINEGKQLAAEEVWLGPELHWARLTVEPMIWFAFQGKSEGHSLILNIGDMEHDPLEVDHHEISEFKYSW